MNQQKHRRRMDSSLSQRGVGSLNAFYWRQIFVLDSAIVIKDREKGHDAQIVRAKENLKLSHGGSSYR